MTGLGHDESLFRSVALAHPGDCLVVRPWQVNIFHADIYVKVTITDTIKMILTIYREIVAERRCTKLSRNGLTAAPPSANSGIV
jgi:hypothetical protein